MLDHIEVCSNRRIIYSSDILNRILRHVYQTFNFLTTVSRSTVQFENKLGSCLLPNAARNLFTYRKILLNCVSSQGSLCA